ncbi:hypothetical protein BC834DRAFT_309446 [Gloeopeniophorella convolvens]|nr:hypothetical protein BC834DRAFT_309446 [Gloeopeniophorella convolvens]
MPLTVNLPHSYKFPDSGDWTPVTSPGGALYFYHDRWRIYTDVYMYDPGLRTEVNEFAARLADRREMQTFPTDDYDLVLDVTTMKDSGEIIWSYYYVDHKTRTLFWLQHYDASETLLYEAFGIQEPGHMKLRLEALYWVHWSLYPVGHGSRVFPRDACEKLLGILTSCSVGNTICFPSSLRSSSVDLLTSKRSTAPYSVADMQTMFSLIKEAKGSDAAAEHVRSSTARLLSFFTHWKFIHFHGQRTSRLDRFKSIHNDDKGRRTILIRSLSAPLFLAPEVHLRELKKLWTDNIIIEAFWKEFMQKLVSEWIEFVLYSTVMLAANVAFLAIQGVIVIPQDPSSKNWIKPSPAQIISSISLVFSVGSIITGLVLIRHNRTMMLQEPKVASEYLTKKHSRRFGLEPLAIIFSLTYALLMWSVWMFFVSLLLFSFQNTTMAIRIALSIAAGIVTIFIIWCILNSWDTGEREEEALILSNEHEPITP